MRAVDAISVIVGIITFPGAYMRAFWQHLTCRLYAIPIDDPRYFNLNEMFGHIDHEMPKSGAKRFLICLWPFLLNLVTGMCIAVPAWVAVFMLGAPDFYDYILLWVGVSLLCSIFPCYEDALAMWESYQNSGRRVKGLAAPVCAVMYGGAVLSGAGLSVVPAVLLTAFLSYLLRIII